MSTLGSDPTPPPRRDLTDTFGGLKLPPRRRSAQDPPAGETPEPPQKAADAGKAARGKAARGKAAAAGGGAGDDRLAKERKTPARGRATASKAKPAGEEPAETAGDQEQDRSQPARGRRGRPRKPASAQADQTLVTNRVVYVPDDVRDALAMMCTRTRRTRTQVVLEAIAATHTRLGDLVEADLAPTVIKGELWDQVVYPNRRSQPAKRQLFITPTIQQLATIDRLVDESGARDRSHLVVVALREHLQTD